MCSLQTSKPELCKHKVKGNYLPIASTELCKYKVKGNFLPIASTELCKYKVKGKFLPILNQKCPEMVEKDEILSHQTHTFSQKMQSNGKTS